jgi:hypothetical protein
MVKLDAPLKHGRVAWAVYALTLLVEIYTAVSPILLNPNFDVKKVNFALYAYTTYPRILILLTCSILLHRKRFWQRYIKINSIVAGAMTVTVSYLLLVKGHGKNWSNLSGDQIHSMVAFGLLIFFLIGHYRVMLKWFPWTRRTFYFYKVVRLIHLVTFVIEQTVAEELENVYFITYFASMLELLHSMMCHADEAEHGIKSKCRAREAMERNGNELNSPLEVPYAQLHDH